MLLIKKLIGSVVLLLFFAQVKGQDEITLRIGDPVPAIKYSKWLKGEPVSSFKKDHVYILEFWATWCGPCKRAMPHLTELQKQYEGKATIISVNIKERIKKGQPYESSLPMVEKFVKGNSANMGFSVIADNNDEYMANNWMKPAGRSSLPTTFIVKDRKVIWIGDPEGLDSLLPKIFDGGFKMATKGSKRLDNPMDERKALTKLITDAIDAKEYEKALQLIDKLIALDPFGYHEVMKLNLLLKLNEKDAIAYGNEIHNSDQNNTILLRGRAAFMIQKTFSENDTLSKSAYLWAARIYEDHYSNHYKHSHHPVIIEQVASLYAKGGDYQKAIDRQQKAIELVKVFLLKKEEPDNITEDLLIQYEIALTRYIENHIAQYKYIVNHLAQYKEILAGYKKLETAKPDYFERYERDSLVNRWKFKLLLKLNEKDAIAFGNEWKNSIINEIYPTTLSQSDSSWLREYAAERIRKIVAEDDELSKSTYLWAGRLYEEAHSNKLHPDFNVRGASLYAKGGDYQKAIALQQKAIKDAKALLSQPAVKRQGITEVLIAEYEEALAEYKKDAKTAKK